MPDRRLQVAAHPGRDHRRARVGRPQRRRRPRAAARTPRPGRPPSGATAISPAQVAAARPPRPRRPAPSTSPAGRAAAVAGVAVEARPAPARRAGRRPRPARRVASASTSAGRSTECTTSAYAGDRARPCCAAAGRRSASAAVGQPRARLGPARPGPGSRRGRGTPSAASGATSSAGKVLLTAISRDLGRVAAGRPAAAAIRVPHRAQVLATCAVRGRRSPPILPAQRCSVPSSRARPRRPAGR